MKAARDRPMQSLPTAADILGFWRGLGPEKWFTRDLDVDAAIVSRFLSVHESAAAGRLSDWERTAEGSLALVIVLDQSPRNMFRGTARAFATDHLARAVAARAIDKGFDRAVAPSERMFFYLPFEHSEDMADQERCLALFRATCDAELLKWAELHADIIRSFGRFPHRNATLGRTTTPDEQAFLDAGGFAG